jgi:hypothetical protein
MIGLAFVQFFLALPGLRTNLMEMARFRAFWQTVLSLSPCLPIEPDKKLISLIAFYLQGDMF